MAWNYGKPNFMINPRKIFACASVLAVGVLIAVSAKAADPVKIGVNLERTGNAASYGGHVLIAAQIAADEINNAGGINGSLIELVVEDNRTLPEQAVIATRNLDVAGVVAILGPIQSSQARTAFPATNRAKLVSISPGSGAPGLSAQNRPWAFRNAAIDQVIFSSLVDEFRKRYPAAKNVWLTYDPKDAYESFLVKKVAPPELERIGLKILNKSEPMEIPTGVNDHSVFVTKIRAVNPDVVLVGLVIEQGRTFLQEMNRQQYKVPLLGGLGFITDAVARSAGNLDFYSGQPFDPDSSDPEVKKFVKEFAIRSKKELPGQYTIPTYIEAGAYEIVKIIANTMNDVSANADLKAKREAIRNAFTNLKDYKGLGNTLTINHEGDVVKPTLVFHTVGGKWELAQ